jgi:hypothetical protein
VLKCLKWKGRKTYETTEFAKRMRILLVVGEREISVASVVGF